MSQDAGQVRVYKWDGSSWQQKGIDIDGEGLKHALGNSVSLSADGNTLVASAPGSDGGHIVWNGGRGHAEIFDWNGSQWEKRGMNIPGLSSGDMLSTVSISQDGSSVALGSHFADEGGMDSGHVRMFDWDGASWVQKGQTIVGSYGDQSGAVELNAKGDIAIIGAPFNDSSGNNAGQARVFKWDGSTWLQLGDSINGLSNDDWEGRHVHINDDGDVVATGAIFNDSQGSQSGMARVFQFDGQNWTQRGQSIYGTQSSENFGVDVALDADGDRLVVGAQYTNHQGKNAAGSVRVFEFPSSSLSSIDLIENSTEALGTISAAIEQVAGQRAEYGALQNRLEYTVSNLMNVSEFTTAARSRIADADFAAESARLAKAQVLQQSGTAMLAQANASSQLALSLIR
jgi:flagellin-like hook-associated protein FlgL